MQILDAALNISIHALREEGDLTQESYHLELKTISIHALREEGDFGKTNRTIHHDLFLSTPSARRATDFRTLFFLE